MNNSVVRWIKLPGEQDLGFWPLGLVLFLLQEVPYLVMPLFRPETNPIMNMTETSAALDGCEKLLGSLCVALMIFLVHRDAKLFSVSSVREKRYFALAAALLLANFAGWALYFAGCQSVFVMMLFLVALPTLYYAAIGLWRRNLPLTVCAAVFFAVHFIHVLRNLTA